MRACVLLCSTVMMVVIRDCSRDGRIFPSLFEISIEQSIRSVLDILIIVDGMMMMKKNGYCHQVMLSNTKEVSSKFLIHDFPIHR